MSLGSIIRSTPDPYQIIVLKILNENTYKRTLRGNPTIFKSSFDFSDLLSLDPNFLIMEPFHHHKKEYIRSICETFSCFEVG